LRTVSAVIASSGPEGKVALTSAATTASSGWPQITCSQRDIARAK
jgi:hypothetical protein